MVASDRADRVFQKFGRCSADHLELRSSSSGASRKTVHITAPRA
jgi:hypothetical protein